MIFIVLYRRFCYCVGNLEGGPARKERACRCLHVRTDSYREVLYMDKTKKGIVAAFAAIGLIVMLVGCGGSSGTASQATTGTTSTQGSTADTSASRGSDDVFLYVAQQLVNTIDPAKVKDETEIIAAVNLYDPLFYPDMANASMDPVPHVASGYTVTPDGTQYTMTVQDGITFQSGNKLTSEDVVYSMERMVAINQGNAWLWSTILADVYAPDASTVVFTLNTSYAPFISSLTQLFIVDSALLKANQKTGEFGENGDYGQAYAAENSVGSGPYKLTAWDRQSYLDFEAFDGYWKGWSDGQIKKARMQTITEESTVRILLVSGQASMVHQWLANTAYADMAKNPDITVYEDPSAKLQYFPINTQLAPTDDINVRKAIAYAFDYETGLVDILGGGVAAAGAVPTVVPGHNEDIKPITRDIAKAKQYLAQSKYAGQPITVSFRYLGDTVEQGQFSQLFSANMREIGINVDLKPVTWAQMTQSALSPETTANLSVISDSLKYPHVDSHTYGIYHSSAAGSYRSMAWYTTPELDAILEKARSVADSAEQIELYKEAQSLAAEVFPAVYFANPIHRVAVRKNVSGYTYVGLMGYDISFYSLRVN